MTRLALHFDGLTTPQLRTVLAAFAAAHNGTQDAPLRHADHGVVVGCDGPEKFNARTPKLTANALALFLQRLDAASSDEGRVLPTYDPSVLSPSSVIA